MNIFVSYSSDDQEMAEAIVGLLEQFGHKCWLASRDCRQDYMAEILPAIRGAHAVVLVTSAAIKTSKHVRTEAGRAIKYEKDVIPVLLGDFDVADFDESWVEYVLEAYQAIKMRNDDACERLLSRLGTIVNGDGNEESEASDDSSLEDLIVGGIAGLAGAALADYLLADEDDE